MTIAEDKAQLRNQFRRERRERFIPEPFLLLLNAPELSGAEVVASYCSNRDEPTTAELNQALLERGCILILPRVSGKLLEWVQWLGDPAELKESAGIFEPTGPAISDLTSIDVVIVPALHIDREGYRLGQGGGFYDRALPTMSGWKVGIVHAGEISDPPLPREGHDFPLSAAATPDLIVRFTP